jgi:hypothetical protein
VDESKGDLAIDMASERLHDGKRMPGKIRQLVKWVAAAPEEARRRVRTAAIAGPRPNSYGKTDLYRLRRSPILVGDSMRWFRRKVTRGDGPGGRPPRPGQPAALRRDAHVTLVPLVLVGGGGHASDVLQAIEARHLELRFENDRWVERSGAGQRPRQADGDLGTLIRRSVRDQLRISVVAGRSSCTASMACSCPRGVPT